MKLDRRTFLATAAAAPLIYGLKSVLGTPDDNEWFRAALQRMKETRRYGIVLVVPADLRLRQTVGTRLRALLDGPSTAAHALFSEAVFICLTPELAAGRVQSGSETHTRILLDPDGRRVVADTMAWATLQPRNFFGSFSRFLHGQDGQRLAGHARTIEQSLPDEVRSALPRLDDASVHARSEASTLVLRHADRMIPYLVHQGLNGESPEARSRCHALVEEFFRLSEAAHFGPRLPYGATRASVAADPCPACGLAVAPVRSRKLLRFLAT